MITASETTNVAVIEVKLDRSQNRDQSQTLAQFQNGACKVRGVVQRFEQPTLSLFADAPIPLGAPVTVQTSERIYLGDVRYCELVDDCSWAIQIQVKRTMMVI